MNKIITSFINNHNIFFPKVKELGKRNASTLGFMPQGGFEDYAKRKCIIIVYDETFAKPSTHSTFISITLNE
ncbi:MAG: hypothetical protein ACTTKJ_06935 [Prevotella koreensis]|uniref:hypothetical protein n=1 Tax=Prevotella koreensis TaxID=2490854 RepID=UPI003FA0FF35